VFDEARQCKNLEEVILAQAGRPPLALQPWNVIDVMGWDVHDKELADTGNRTPRPRLRDCRKPFLEPDEDDEGKCYCPNCGVLLTDDNCLNAEDLDSRPPKPRPTLLKLFLECFTRPLLS
jgi:hypothetical protein